MSKSGEPTSNTCQYLNTDKSGEPTSNTCQYLNTNKSKSAETTSNTCQYLNTNKSKSVESTSNTCQYLNTNKSKSAEPTTSNTCQYLNSNKRKSAEPTSNTCQYLNTNKSAEPTSNTCQYLNTNKSKSVESTSNTCQYLNTNKSKSVEPTSNTCQYLNTNKSVESTSNTCQYLNTNRSKSVESTSNTCQYLNTNKSVESTSNTCQYLNTNKSKSVEPTSNTCQYLNTNKSKSVESTSNTCQYLNTNKSKLVEPTSNTCQYLNTNKNKSEPANITCKYLTNTKNISTVAENLGSCGPESHNGSIRCSVNSSSSPKSRVSTIDRKLAIDTKNLSINSKISSSAKEWIRPQLSIPTDVVDRGNMLELKHLKTDNFLRQISVGLKKISNYRKDLDESCVPDAKSSKDRPGPKLVMSRDVLDQKSVNRRMFLSSFRKREAMSECRGEVSQGSFKTNHSRHTPPSEPNQRTSAPATPTTLNTPPTDPHQRTSAPATPTTLNTPPTDPHQRTSAPATPTSLNTPPTDPHQRTSAPATPTSLNTPPTDPHQRTSAPATPTSLNTPPSDPHQRTSAPATPTSLNTPPSESHQRTSAPATPTTLNTPPSESQQRTSAPATPTTLNTVLHMLNQKKIENESSTEDSSRRFKNGQKVLFCKYLKSDGELEVPSNSVACEYLIWPRGTGSPAVLPSRVRGTGECADRAMGSLGAVQKTSSNSQYSLCLMTENTSQPAPLNTNGTQPICTYFQNFSNIGCSSSKLDKNNRGTNDIINPGEENNKKGLSPCNYGMIVNDVKQSHEVSESLSARLSSKPASVASQDPSRDSHIKFNKLDNTKSNSTRLLNSAHNKIIKLHNTTVDILSTLRSEPSSDTAKDFVHQGKILKTRQRSLNDIQVCANDTKERQVNSCELVMNVKRRLSKLSLSGEDLKETHNNRIHLPATAAPSRPSFHDDETGLGAATRDPAVLCSVGVQISLARNNPQSMNNTLSKTENLSETNPLSRTSTLSRSSTLSDTSTSAGHSLARVMVEDDFDSSGSEALEKYDQNLAASVSSVPESFRANDLDLVPPPTPCQDAGDKWNSPDKVKMETLSLNKIDIFAPFLSQTPTFITDNTKRNISEEPNKLETENYNYSVPAVGQPPTGLETITTYFSAETEFLERRNDNSVPGSLLSSKSHETHGEMRKKELRDTRDHCASRRQSVNETQVPPDTSYGGGTNIQSSLHLSRGVPEQLRRETPMTFGMTDLVTTFSLVDSSLSSAQGTLNQTGALSSAQGTLNQTGALSSAQGTLNQTSALSSAQGTLNQTGALSSAQGTLNQTGALSSAQGTLNQTGALSSAQGTLNQTGSLSLTTESSPPWPFRTRRSCTFLLRVQEVLRNLPVSGPDNILPGIDLPLEPTQNLSASCNNNIS
nr:mucin-3B-like [Procambarus clarkii]